MAPNKFLAKIASGWKKPDGLTVISPERVEPFLQQLPVDALWGVGPVTARKLRARGIERLVDVRDADAAAAARDGRQPRRLAAAARQRHRRSAGRRRTARRSRPARENTYPEDLTDLDADPRGDRRDGGARRRLARRARQLLARTVTIKVRYYDFTTVTRSHTAAPTRDEARLTARAVQLLDKTDAGAPAGPPARRQRAQFLRRTAMDLPAVRESGHQSSGHD